MEGVRVLEVAQFTFVPAAGAVLADWGADVIKVEHAEKGDGQRGLGAVLGLDAITKGSSFLPIMEGPNRGKRSIGLSLEKAEALEVLYELVKTSDVFLTNFLEEARKRLKIDVDDIRAINPNIIYVSGTGHGPVGPDKNLGGYDGSSFWARGGSADGSTPSDSPFLGRIPGGAYGDNMGGMTIAGGIAGALFHRERTGVATVVDVSLLHVGAWATSYNTNLALMSGGPLPKMPVEMPSRNPCTGTYKTADSRWVTFMMLQPGRYWPEVITAFGRPELATDERFKDAEAIMANGTEGTEILKGIIGSMTKDEVVKILGSTSGQWSLVQDAYEVGHDPALVANGAISDVVDAEGVTRQLVVNPVQFDREQVKLTRAPLFAEHTDEILTELGLDEEAQIGLKIAGAAT